MFPIGDDDRALRIVPLVTYSLLALNLLFFFVARAGIKMGLRGTP